MACSMDLIKFASDEERTNDIPMNILILGDSEAKQFGDAKQRLQNQFLFNIKIDYKRGTSLLDTLPMIHRSMDELTDIVIVTGLTCFSWKKIPFNEEEPNSLFLITHNEDYSNHNVAQYMEELVQACQQKNTDVKVYLLIPTIKDIFKFNKKYLYKQRATHKQKEIERTYKFSLAYLSNKAREIFHQHRDLVHNEEFNWTNRLCMKMTPVVINLQAKQSRIANLDKNDTPMGKYITGLTNTLDSDIVPDGIHCTSDAILQLFYNQQEFCPWIVKNPKASLSIGIHLKPKAPTRTTRFSTTDQRKQLELPSTSRHHRSTTTHKDTRQIATRVDLHYHSRSTTTHHSS